MRPAIVVLLAAAASSYQASAETLTFDEALSRATAQAPALEARERNIEASRSSATTARQLPDPELGFAVENIPISGPPAFDLDGESMTMATLSVSQGLPNGAKRQARAIRAEADVTAASAELLSEARRVRTSTALAWVDLAYSEKRLAALDEVIGRLRPLVGASSAALSSGSARPAEALEIRQKLIELDDRRSELVAGVARARSTLSRWTGDPDPQVAGEVPGIAIDADDLRTAIERHPDVEAAASRTGQARADIALAEAERRPDWAFDLAYQKRAPRYGDMVSAGVTVSLPLFQTRRQAPMIAASTSRAVAAAAEQEDVRRALSADLEAGLADHDMHHEQWMRTYDRLLPLARQRAELEAASYSAGRASLIDVIAAEAMLADAELLALDREADVKRDGVRLVLTFGDEQ